MGIRPFQKVFTRFYDGSTAEAARMEWALEAWNFKGVNRQELRSEVRFFRKFGGADVRGNLGREAKGLRL
jgi:hypothetical protein